MLNLRCLYCQTPFTVARAEMLTALITMEEKNQNHHDAHCPRCRRANSISRQRMELFFPNWRDAAKQAASMPAAQAVKTEPLPKALKSAGVKTAATKKKTAASAKPSASKRQRASKPATAKKTTPSSTKTKTTTPKSSKTIKSTSKTKKK